MEHGLESRSSRNPIVYNDDGAAPDHGCRTIFAIRVNPAVEFLPLEGNLGGKKLLGHPETVDQISIYDRRPIFADGSDSELRVVRGSQLPRQSHLELTSQRSRHLIRDDHSPAGNSQDKG
jgi:hypothetical protein